MSWDFKREETKFEVLPEGKYRIRIKSADKSYRIIKRGRKINKGNKHKIFGYCSPKGSSIFNPF